MFERWTPAYLHLQLSHCHDSPSNPVVPKKTPRYRSNDKTSKKIETSKHQAAIPAQLCSFLLARMAKAKKASKTAQYRVVDSDAASNLHRVGPAYGLIAVLLVIAGGSITNHFLRNLPDALSVADLEQSPEAVFIGERAWKDLRSFTELGPRTTGSRANDELAVGIFKREIAAIQEGKHPDQEVLMENQVVTGAFNFTFYGTSMTTVYRNVQNVVVKLVGESEDALLLNCHFDTVCNPEVGMINLC